MKTTGALSEKMGREASNYWPLVIEWVIRIKTVMVRARASSLAGRAVLINLFPTAVLTSTCFVGK
jgi:hypothetical protein